MEKYKLIETYPGSPDIGYELRPSSEGILRYYWKTWFDPEQYPKNWEKVIEKEYEILSFKNKDNGMTYFKDSSGTFSTKNSNGGLTTVGFRSLEYCMSYYTPTSVKRLSDEEVFSIGDKVRISKLQHDGSFIIEKFYLSTDGVSLLCNGKGGNGHVSITKIEHSKAIFTTEDGVDMFEGEKCFWVFTTSYNPAEGLAREELLPLQSYQKAFSTEKAAEDFVLTNKPCLSYKEVVSTLKLHWTEEHKLKLFIARKIFNENK